MQMCGNKVYQRELELFDKWQLLNFLRDDHGNDGGNNNDTMIIYVMINVIVYNSCKCIKKWCYSYW